MMFVQLMQDLSECGSAQAVIRDSGDVITVTNRGANEMLGVGLPGEAGALAFVTEIGGDWEIVAVECP